MADNYLERRMDDYRSGRLSAATASTVRRMKPSTRSVRFTPRRVLASGDLFSDVAVRLMTDMVAAGCQVTFIDADERRGRLTAQRAGALFVPGADRDRLQQLRPDGFDAEVSFAEGSVAIGGSRITYSASTPPADISRSLLFLLEPLNIISAQIEL